VTTPSAIAFACAFLVTFALTPVVTASLRRTGRMDVPNARSSHSTAVPRGGGLACAAGVGAGLAVAHPETTALVYSTFAAVTLLTVVGYLDDHVSLPSSARLLVQLSSGALVGAPLGVGWAIVASGVFVVLVNCVNFMDGIDGITSATMLGWGLTAMYVAGSHDIPLLGVLGLVTAATALGFLPWNAPRAHVFLGDVGSYLYGGLVASGTVLAIQAGVSVAVVLAPLTVYLFDVGLTLLRRVRRRAQILDAHREHIYQRLPVEVGLSHVMVTLYITTLNAVIITLWLWAPASLAVVFTAAVLLVYACSVPLGTHLLVKHRERQAS